MEITYYVQRGTSGFSELGRRSRSIEKLMRMTNTYKRKALPYRFKNLLG
jgi:hypothetical protein